MMMIMVVLVLVLVRMAVIKEHFYFSLILTHKSLHKLTNNTLDEIIVYIVPWERFAKGFVVGKLNDVFLIL